MEVLFNAYRCVDQVIKAQKFSGQRFQFHIRLDQAADLYTSHILSTRRTKVSRRLAQGNYEI